MTPACGSVSNVGVDQGVIVLGPVSCLARNTTATSVEDDALPLSSEALVDLVRRLVGHLAPRYSLVIYLRRKPAP